MNDITLSFSPRGYMVGDQFFETRREAEEYQQMNVVTLGPEYFSPVLTSSVDVTLRSGRTLCVDVTRYGEIERVDGPTTDAEDAEILAILMMDLVNERR